MFGSSAYSETSIFKYRRSAQPTDLASCYAAVGADMHKVMADFDRVLQRELKPQATQTQADLDCAAPGKSDG